MKAKKVCGNNLIVAGPGCLQGVYGCVGGCVVTIKWFDFVIEVEMIDFRAKTRQEEREVHYMQSTLTRIIKTQQSVARVPADLAFYPCSHH